MKRYDFDIMTFEDCYFELDKLPFYENTCPDDDQCTIELETSTTTVRTTSSQSWTDSTTALQLTTAADAYGIFNFGVIFFTGGRDYYDKNTDAVVFCEKESNIKEVNIVI